MTYRTINYLRQLLLFEEQYLTDLKGRRLHYPSLDEAIAYQIGRVEAYRELIKFLEG